MIDPALIASLAAFDDAALAEGAKRIVTMARDPATSERCREAATALFSLSGGVEAYRTIYGALASGDRLAGHS